ncbi:hypothetical protein C8R43DRAFT_1152944 [Mycena crocata]|nr:hypothetical protein C8R43DRAFT_1152944 [Mycena crocata]
MALVPESLPPLPENPNGWPANIHAAYVLLEGAFAHATLLLHQEDGEPLRLNLASEKLVNEMVPILEQLELESVSQEFTHACAHAIGPLVCELKVAAMAAEGVEHNNIVFLEPVEIEAFAPNQNIKAQHFANTIGVERTLLHKQMKAAGIKSRKEFDVISDADLDARLRKLVEAGVSQEEQQQILTQLRSLVRSAVPAPPPPAPVAAPAPQWPAQPSYPVQVSFPPAAPPPFMYPFSTYDNMKTETPPSVLASASGSSAQSSILNLLSTLKKAGIVSESGTPVGTGTLSSEDVCKPEPPDLERESSSSYKDAFVMHNVKLTSRHNKVRMILRTSAQTWPQVMRRRADLDQEVAEWTGSEDQEQFHSKQDTETSEDEWSNPSDEEHARQQRVERRMQSRLEDQPRRVPNFPHSPDNTMAT